MLNSWIISLVTGIINQTSQNLELHVIESPLKTYSDIALIITGIFTVILVFVLIGQTRILKTQVGEMKKQTENILEESKLHRMEIESTIRPWIGIVGNPQHNGSLRENSLYRISLQNWGKIPPKQLYTYIAFSKSQILVEHVKKMKGMPYASGTLLPNDTTGINYPLNTEEFNKVREGIDKIWFSVLVEYNYGNNLTGEYCAIYVLHSNGGFERMEQWAA